jgi:3-oxoacyl-[acyl-carrier protein] reductase
VWKAGSETPGVPRLAGPNPGGRFGEADEVAGVVVMLAENAYITGQTIHVNGGWYMS